MAEADLRGMPGEDEAELVRRRAAESDALLRLHRARGFVFDLDGVLYRGSALLPGVNDLFNALELREKRFILATNNSMSSPEEYVAKLGSLGVEVDAERILTAG